MKLTKVTRYDMGGLSNQVMFEVRGQVAQELGGYFLSQLYIQLQGQLNGQINAQLRDIK